jgi:hypothetical protein
MSIFSKRLGNNTDTKFLNTGKSVTETPILCGEASKFKGKKRYLFKEFFYSIFCTAAK